jgi:HPt (histidine-containing phosphotransfer) domain-containing protein
MTDKKPEIVFMPGCFDHFDGTQEELDALVAEIQQMFEGKTPEDLEELGRPMTDEDFEELPDDIKEQIVNSFENMDKRKLQ